MRLHTSDHEPGDALDLDRLWAATRPEEPSAETFDRLWNAALARASEPEVVRFPGAKAWGLGLAIFAQAAALLVAAGLALRAPTRKEAGPAPVEAPVVASVPEIQVDGGTIPIVHLGDRRGVIRGVEIRPQTPESETDMVADDLAVLGHMESL